jgi:hypothetical protein
MEKNIKINMAIKNLCPDAEYVFTDNDIETIQWIKGENPPSTKEILLEIEKVELNFDAEIKNKEQKRVALLEKLGITEDEAKLLLG